MDVTEWEYREFEGQPHDEERGYVLGFDGNHQAYILKWNEDAGCWLAVTIDAGQGRVAPIAHALTDDNELKIVKWAALPLRWTDLDAAEGKLNGR